MQILQWLFKIADQEPPKTVSNSSPITQNQGDKDQNVESKDIAVLSTERGAPRRRRKGVEKTKLNCENLSLFCFLQRKKVSRPFFYHTLNLKRLGSFQKRRHSVHSVKMKREEDGRGVGISNKADSATHVGNKVLPITESAQSSSGRKDNNQCPDSDKKEKTKGDKTKTIARMKELMKWAAYAKGQKGGKCGIERKILNFKNRSAFKAVAADDDQFSNESPKISFKWDIESCSTASSVYSAISAISKASSSLKNGQIQCADGTGNWITTDSEFVVLEL